MHDQDVDIDTDSTEASMARLSLGASSSRKRKGSTPPLVPTRKLMRIGKDRRHNSGGVKHQDMQSESDPLPDEAEPDRDDTPIEADIDKPVRVLTDFKFYSSLTYEAHDFGYLEGLDDEGDCDLIGQGIAAACFWDSVADDGAEDESEEKEGHRYISLSSLFRWWIDYEELEGPVWVETQFAWYILRQPAQEYSSLFYSFLRPFRIAQLAISTIANKPDVTWREFEKAFSQFKPDDIEEYGFSGFKLGDLRPRSEAVKVIAEECTNDLRNKSKTLRKLINVWVDVEKSTSAHSLPQQRPPVNGTKLNPTCVTGAIYELTSGFFREQLKVANKSRHKYRLQDSKAPVRARMKLLLQRAHDILTKQLPLTIGKPTQEDYISGTKRLHQLTIDDVCYKIGDAVALVPNILPPHGSSERYLHNVFELARIISIKEDCNNSKVFVLHLQELLHGTSTILDNVCDEQELFLSGSCRSISAEDVLGRVEVKFIDQDPSVVSIHDLSFKNYDYVCKFLYDVNCGSFTRVTLDYPGKCAVCALQENKLAQSSPRMNDNRSLEYKGVEYHVNDFVLVKVHDGSSSTPASIAQICNLNFTSHHHLYVRWLGRVRDVNSSICDERLLFLTEERGHIDPRSLLEKCTVLYLGDVDKVPDTLDINFYATYQLPERDSSWSCRRLLSNGDLKLCTTCRGERHKRKAFLKSMPKVPLRTLDLFAGTSGFSTAISRGFPSLHVTHAIEIDADACETIRHNSPDTIVINSCVNIALEAAVKAHKTSPDQRSSTQHRLPLPGDIDIIVAGFPCQSHSSMNMFKRVDDPKTNLMLTLLSNVDFYKPQFCFFENVWNFVNTPLMGRQEGPHCITGGIEHGALRFMLYALTVMGYQCHFRVLQAGSYGTAQSRERFFLIAARMDCQLPSFPKATHAFSRQIARKLAHNHHLPEIKMNTPILGSAHYPLVTVEDAIGDLKRFHWSVDDLPMIEEFGNSMFLCKLGMPYYGLMKTPYLHPPTSTFQTRCRADKLDTVLQHYTLAFSLEVVRRTISISLRANADYRTLNRNLWSWELADPMSATARHGFKAGAYSRLDPQKWFHTSITNVSPTAKQSWILNPWCARVLTIRELARSQGFPDSFVFRTVGDDLDDSRGKVKVRSIHRQIGNGVAWPVAIALGRQLRLTLEDLWISSFSEE